MPGSLCPKCTFECACAEVSLTQVVKNLQHCESPIYIMGSSSIIADVFCLPFNSVVVVVLVFLKQVIRTFYYSNINSICSSPKWKNNVSPWTVFYTAFRKQEAAATQLLLQQSETRL